MTIYLLSSTGPNKPYYTVQDKRAKYMENVGLPFQTAYHNKYAGSDICIHQIGPHSTVAAYQALLLHFTFPRIFALFLPHVIHFVISFSSLSPLVKNWQKKNSVLVLCDPMGDEGIHSRTGQLVLTTCRSKFKWLARLFVAICTFPAKYDETCVSIINLLVLHPVHVIFVLLHLWCCQTSRW